MRLDGPGPTCLARPTSVRHDLRGIIQSLTKDLPGLDEPYWAMIWWDPPQTHAAVPWLFAYWSQVLLIQTDDMKTYIKCTFLRKEMRRPSMKKEDFYDIKLRVVKCTLVRKDLSAFKHEPGWMSERLEAKEKNMVKWYSRKSMTTAHSTIGRYPLLQPRGRRFVTLPKKRCCLIQELTNSIGPVEVWAKWYWRYFVCPIGVRDNETLMK